MRSRNGNSQRYRSAAASKCNAKVVVRVEATYCALCWCLESRCTFLPPPFTTASPGRWCTSAKTYGFLVRCCVPPSNSASDRHCRRDSRRLRRAKLRSTRNIEKLLSALTLDDGCSGKSNTPDQVTPPQLKNLKVSSNSNETKLIKPSKMPPERVGPTLGGLLDIQAMADMIGFLDRWGQFSYYILDNHTLVLHLEDIDAINNCNVIREHVIDIIRRCEKARATNVVVVEQSFEGALCSVGATVFVNDDPQTIGMYVGYEGLVYWVSSAHGLLPAIDWKSVKSCKRNSGTAPKSDECDAKCVYLTAVGDERDGVDEHRVPTPKPYACLDCCPPSGKLGLRSMHYVDIMVGIMPLRTSMLEIHQSLASYSSLHTVRECSQCIRNECCNPMHDSLQSQYRINAILMLNRFSAAGYEYYDASKLMGKLVQCRPRRQNIVCGKIMSYQNNLFVRPTGSNEPGISVTNVLIIKPIGRVGPKAGDSGSVWVLHGTETAIAMTVGMGKIRDETSSPPRRTEVWLATLLHPAIDAVCAAHPSQFADPRKVVPLAH